VSVEHFVSSMEKVVARGDEMDPSAMQHKLDPYDSRDFRVPVSIAGHFHSLHNLIHLVCLFVCAEFIL